ncbi:MAG TPA: hypothetical protein VFH90_07155 [Candidatus Limnocylindria bacterium]|nr:hypothetical protein [Candidatus Limnocylindria bacterium]
MRIQPRVVLLTPDVRDDDVLTTIGGASLTRSLTAIMAGTPLRVAHHETGSLLADIIQLVSDKVP